MLQPKLTSEQVRQSQTFIASASHIVIITHMSPDGDAMGSSLGMYHYLRSIGKQDVTVVVPNIFPVFLRWMPRVSDCLIYDVDRERADKQLVAADLLICTDFNAPKRIGALGDKMLSLSCPKIMIDHHLDPVPFADVMISYSDSPSASELVYRLIYQMNMLHNTSDAPLALSLDAATCLYTGMMTDTGNFSYNSNYSEMYEIVSQLVSLGVDKDEVYRNVFNSYSVDRMRLVGYCLYEKMRIFPKHHAALIFLKRRELYRFNFQSGDAEGLVNLPLQIDNIHYSCFMREDKVAEHERVRAAGATTKVKLSLRSQGNRPVNVFAADVFNGGGHFNAAGGEFFGSVANAVKCFMDNFPRYFLTD